MKRLSEFSFGELLSSINKNRSSSSSRTPTTNQTEDLQKQLADAQKEAQNALAEWRRYPNHYYELAWAEAIDKVKRLLAFSRQLSATWYPQVQGRRSRSVGRLRASATTRISCAAGRKAQTDLLVASQHEPAHLFLSLYQRQL